jgi:hypothetical protein
MIKNNSKNIYEYFVQFGKYCAMSKNWFLCTHKIFDGKQERILRWQKSVRFSKWIKYGVE